MHAVPINLSQKFQVYRDRETLVASVDTIEEARRVMTQNVYSAFIVYPGSAVMATNDKRAANMKYGRFARNA